MLELVVAYWYVCCTVQKDISCLQDRVHEQTGRDSPIVVFGVKVVCLIIIFVLHCVVATVGFTLPSSHPSQSAHTREATEQPEHACMRRYMCLIEQHTFRRINAHCQQRSNHTVLLALKVDAVLWDCQCMQTCYEEEELCI